jgi:hypothetical protein
MNYWILATYIALSNQQVFLFTGSLRRQGPIVQPLDRWRNGFLPAQEPRIAPHGTDGISFGIVSSEPDRK